MYADAAAKAHAQKEAAMEICDQFTWLKAPPSSDLKSCQATRQSQMRNLLKFATRVHCVNNGNVVLNPEAEAEAEDTPGGQLYIFDCEDRFGESSSQLENFHADKNVMVQKQRFLLELCEITSDESTHDQIPPESDVQYEIKKVLVCAGPASCAIRYQQWNEEVCRAAKGEQHELDQKVIQLIY